MKKYLAIVLILPFMAFAQEVSTPDTTDAFLVKGNKKIDYELSVLEGERLIFKSDFSVMNGEKSTVFKREIHREKDGALGKKLQLGKESLSQELDSVEVKDSNLEILRLTGDITRETENLISKFYITQVAIGIEKKESKKESILENAPNGAFTQETPGVEKETSSFSVIHKKNKDIVFVSDDRTYSIKAKY